MTENIFSARLELGLMTPAFLQASLEGNLRAAADHLGAYLPGSWPLVDGPGRLSEFKKTGRTLDGCGLFDKSWPEVDQAF